MEKVYANLVRLDQISIDEVPPELREAVEEILDQQEQK